MLRTVITVACLFALTVSLDAEPWPQWRGPRRDGVSKEKGLPTHWSADSVLWRLKLPGMGGATPCIWEDKIFLTSDDGPEVVLMCISTTGKENWRRALGKSWSRPVRADEGNAASPSPSTDGKLVYAFVGSGEFAAFDFTGTEQWRFNAAERYGKFDIQFGMHTTPLLDGDRLYLPLIHSGGAWVIAIDKHTGQDVWKVERPSDGTDENEHSYASPALWRGEGRPSFLIVHGNDYTTGHRLEDGKEIWRVGELNPRGQRYNRFLRFVASPVATPELIVIPTAKNGVVVGLKPTAEGRIGPGSPHEAWRTERDTPDVPSPLVYEGLVYLCRENGILLCLDAATGKEYYRQRLHPGRYRASPVAADGKIYCTARDGTVSVIEAGKTFKLLAANKLPDQVSASPALADGRIYLRGFDSLWAIGAK
jgi:outer membrane protein assembly factor BamB